MEMPARITRRWHLPSRAPPRAAWPIGIADLWRRCGAPIKTGESIRCARYRRPGPGRAYADIQPRERTRECEA